MDVPPGACILFLLVCSLLPRNTQAVFGEAIGDKVVDDRFKNMGQAYIAEFEIVDSQANFEVVLEDTLNEFEYWVVDFQQYGAYGSMAVDPDTGDISPENTGDCSSVIFNAPFDHENRSTGYYFTDDGNFNSRNVSVVGDQSDAADKRLFTGYQRGSTFTDTDGNGNTIQRQNYRLTFNENFGFFFNCTDTNGDNIWSFSNTTDTIEYKTTIYFTNVRPVDPTDGTKGMSYVTSSVTLFYRLSRVAIVNFIVSSVALVKPVLDYVIIDLYFPPETPAIPDSNKATIELQFQTTIESPSGELLSLLNSTSFSYIAKNDSASSFINFDLGYEFPDGTQQCQYNDTAKCRQIWYFKFILDLDVEVPEDDTPIDATGTFKFQFAKYLCNDATEKNPIDCTSLNQDPLTISLEVTIQTVVQVVDSTKDRPTIRLLSLSGTNGEDLRSGGGRRGVNHLERVDITVEYIPEFLRTTFDLELTLFMVCKLDLQGSEGGCLEADRSQRYVAFSSEGFEFTLSSNYVYNSSSLDDDNKVQTLARNEYNSATAEYHMGFVNSALSQERQTYTITTVFRLIEKPIVRRRRRAVAQQEMLNILLDGGSEASSELVPSRMVAKSRRKRGIMHAVSLPQRHIYAMLFNGCPANSTFDEEKYHCQCNRPEENYSTESFACEGSRSLVPELNVIDVTEVNKPGPSGAPSCSVRVPMILVFLIGAIVLYVDKIN